MQILRLAADSLKSVIVACVIKYFTGIKDVHAVCHVIKTEMNYHLTNTIATQSQHVKLF